MLANLSSWTPGERIRALVLCFDAVQRSYFNDILQSEGDQVWTWEDILKRVEERTVNPNAAQQEYLQEIVRAKMRKEESIREYFNRFWRE